MHDLVNIALASVLLLAYAALLIADTPLPIANPLDDDDGQ